MLLLLFIYFVVFLSQLFDRKKLQKLPAHGLSKSLPFFARATLCEHSVERRLSLVSAVPISGTKELASRTPIIVWHTRSDTFVLIPLLELTRAVAQTVPDLFKHHPLQVDCINVGAGSASPKPRSVSSRPCWRDLKNQCRDVSHTFDMTLQRDTQAEVIP